MKTDSELKRLVGKRVKLIKMVDEPYPIVPTSLGTIYHVGFGVLNVNWDNGRNLGLIEGVDKYLIVK